MHQDPQSPVVHGPVVALVQDCLWCDVFWSSAERPRLAAVAQLFGKTEVDQFDVTFRVQEQVFGFEISVNEASRVEVFECLDDASCYEPGGVVVEAASVPEDCPHFSTQARLQEHVDIFGVLVRSV